MRLIRLPLLFSMSFFFVSTAIWYFSYQNLFHERDFYSNDWCVFFIFSFIKNYLLLSIVLFSALVCLLFNYGIDKMTVKNSVLLILIAILTSFLLKMIPIYQSIGKLTFSLLLIFGLFEGFLCFFDHANEKEKGEIKVMPNVIHLLFCNISVFSYELLDEYIITPYNHNTLKENHLFNENLSGIFQNMNLISVIRMIVSFIFIFFITKGLFNKFYTSMPIGDTVRAMGRIWIRTLLAGIAIALIIMMFILLSNTQNIMVLTCFMIIAILLCYIKITRSAVRKYFYQAE